MCLGIPLKVVEINDKKALGEINGIKREIRIDLLKNVKLGDYVMVHAGFAIEIMDEKNAKITLDEMNEMKELLSE